MSDLPNFSKGRIDPPVEDGPSVDYVNHPPHYRSPATCPQCGYHIECIDIIEHMDILPGTAVKYLWRAGEKHDEIEDLRKSIWYINRRIDFILRNTNPTKE